ncbi:phosphatidic acid phosphatase type 2/haloperoxidase [Bisporella sp. PMI_857]|nr:phosphatidic acid phosphatase type 2/haloperoxidase [Bisporella sp. PMI_857]
MKFLSVLLLSIIASVESAYQGDIVQYWVDQSAILVNGTVINGLQSPPSGWFEAIVQGAVYLAATRSQEKSLSFQQLAVSHAAHDSLLWTFHGTRLYATINSKLKAILPAIGLNATSPEAVKAVEIGRNAAKKVITARADDGINNFVDYQPLPAAPGVYQPTPGGQPIPDTPQARFIRLFGGLGDVTRFRAPPPPSPASNEYEKYLLQVKLQGQRNSSVRTAYDTETAYFWRESSPIGWNRLAHAVVGNSLAENVTASAKFYAQLNYALANAAIASWDSKYTYNSWRPVTAIRYPFIYLPSGLNVSDSTWTPLLTPTPNHQDYLSTHATFGGAAGAVIGAWNEGDEVDVQLSSNVTVDNVGVITRRITSINRAVKDNGDSRIFGGIHFQFASDVGNKIGDWVGRETLAVFDKKWDQF